MAGIYCRGCGYDLRLLTTHQCPECGLDFDPRVPASVLKSRSNPSKRLLFLALAGILMILVSLGFARAWFRTGQRGVFNGFGVAYGVFLAGGFLTEIVTACLSAIRFGTRFTDPRIRYGRHTLKWAIGISWFTGVLIPLVLGVLGLLQLLPRD